MTRNSGADVRETLDAIRRLVQGIRSPSRRAPAAAGLTAAELFVLHALRERHAQSLNELAARTYTDQSTASPVVERLRRRGYVKRERSSQDARRVVIALTPAGRTAVERAPEAPQSAMIAALARLPARDRRALARGLTRLVVEMGLGHERAGMLFEDNAR
jgi:MarR family transcriptional regulator, lower aerobic nicotinate degradation pathway regulator